MRKKFPANFTDLVTLALVIWLIKDFGVMFNSYYSDNIFIEAREVIFESIKTVLSVTVLISRIMYNRKERS